MLGRLKELLKRKTVEPSLVKSHYPFVDEPSVMETEIYYDKWTDKYLDCYGDIFQAVRPESDEAFLSYLKEGIGLADGMKMLDAGCGICGPSIYFAKENEVTIDAITISNVQVEIAKKKIIKAGLTDKVKVIKGDFHNLDKIYKPDSYDIVYFLESLGYANRLDSLISGVYKVLKPGGCIYIKDYFFVPANEELHFAAQTETAVEVRREYCYRLLDIQNLISILRQTGLYLVFIRRREFTDDYTKAADFEKRNGHGNVCLRAMVNPYPLYEPLELKFQKIV